MNPPADTWGAGEGTTDRMHPQLRTATVAVIVVLALIAFAAGALMIVAYFQNQEELILPSAGIAVVAMLAIKFAERAGRG